MDRSQKSAALRDRKKRMQEAAAKMTADAAPKRNPDALTKKVTATARREIEPQTSASGTTMSKKRKLDESSSRKQISSSDNPNKAASASKGLAATGKIDTREGTGQSREPPSSELTKGKEIILYSRREEVPQMAREKAADDVLEKKTIEDATPPFPQKDDPTRSAVFNSAVEKIFGSTSPHKSKLPKVVPPPLKVAKVVEGSVADQSLIVPANRITEEVMMREKAVMVDKPVSTPDIGSGEIRAPILNEKEKLEAQVEAPVRVDVENLVTSEHEVEFIPPPPLRAAPLQIVESKAAGGKLKGKADEKLVVHQHLEDEQDSMHPSAKKLDALEKEFHKQQASLFFLKNVGDDMDSLQREVTHLRKECETSKNSNSQLLEEFESVCADLANYREGYLDLSSEFDAYRTQNSLDMAAMHSRLASLEGQKHADLTMTRRPDPVELSKSKMAGFQLCVDNMVQRGVFPRSLLSDKAFMDLVADPAGLKLKMNSGSNIPRSSQGNQRYQTDRRSPHKGPYGGRS